MASDIILSVSELNQAAQRLLEDTFSTIWVQGEISNLVRPVSGHFYFSLKDQKAQVRCVFFRQRSLALSFTLHNGLLVKIRAKASLYPDRGDFQLITEQIEMAGDGLLKQAYDALVQKLSKEGLFEEQHKKPLPFLPTHIGIISSSTGAALHDILSVLKRRFPSIPLTLYPTKVQGSEAASEIVRALVCANTQGIADLLILARGGGSLEDLWPFNEEIVARAIFASSIPIITGVGHEIDFTIADLVADRRAPTPSAAAEMATPERSRLQQMITTLQSRLRQQINTFLNYRSQKIDWLSKSMRHPAQQIQDQMNRLQRLETQLQNSIQTLLKRKQTEVTHSLRALEGVSPLATLNRGYAIVFDQDSGHILTSVEALRKPEQRLNIRLKDGTLRQEMDGWSCHSRKSENPV